MPRACNPSTFPSNRDHLLAFSPRITQRDATFPRKIDEGNRGKLSRRCVISDTNHVDPPTTFNSLSFSLFRERESAENAIARQMEQRRSAERRDDNDFLEVSFPKASSPGSEPRSLNTTHDTDLVLVPILPPRRLSPESSQASAKGREKSRKRKNATSHATWNLSSTIHANMPQFSTVSTPVYV